MLDAFGGHSHLPARPSPWKVRTSCSLFSRLYDCPSIVSGMMSGHSKLGWHDADTAGTGRGNCR